MSFINKLTSDFKKVWLLCFLLLGLAITCSAQVVYPMDQLIPNYYQAEWHVVVPDNGSPRLEQIMTHYRCDDETISYADETTNMEYSKLLNSDYSVTDNGIEDGLKLTKYTSEYKHVLVYTNVKGEFEYLAYHGIKGMYFSLNDEKAARQMLKNLLREYNSSIARS